MMPRDDVADVAVQQRLAASENHDRGAAFVDRVKAFGDAEPLIEDRIGIVDLAAAGAGEIAAEQRFEHQHQRIALDPAQMTPENIGPDMDGLAQWNGHAIPS